MKKVPYGSEQVLQSFTFEVSREGTVDAQVSKFGKGPVSAR